MTKFNSRLSPQPSKPPFENVLMSSNLEKYFASIYKNGAFIDANCSLEDLMMIRKESNQFIKMVSNYLSTIRETKAYPLSPDEFQLKDLAFRFNLFCPGKIIVHSEIKETLETTDMLIYSGSRKGLEMMLELSQVDLGELMAVGTIPALKNFTKHLISRKKSFNINKPAMKFLRKSFLRSLELFKPTSHYYLKRV